MAQTGLEIFDRTIQTTNIWLDEIMDTTGPDRQLAWKVLSTVLHKLRDRLPMELSAHLGAQLPLMVRGVYYDQYRPSVQPADWDAEEFADEVAKWLKDARPVDPHEAIRAVFGVLAHHLDPDQVDKVERSLPMELRAFWVPSNGAAGHA